MAPHSFDGCTVLRFDNKSSTKATLMLVKRAGPRPSGDLVKSLLAAGRKDNTGKPVVLLGGGATCGNAVGRQIERTSRELWRGGFPILGAEKTHRRGEIHVDVWHLKGGGYITLASRGDRPATLITTSDANCEVLYAASFLQPLCSEWPSPPLSFDLSSFPESFDPIYLILGFDLRAYVLNWADDLARDHPLDPYR
jgi:hypothetical protein